MRSAAVVGIDPGKTGAIAWIERDGTVGLMDMQDNPYGQAGDVISLLLRLHSTHNDYVTVWIEKVSAMPKQGVSSTFSFGTSYGAVIGGVAGASACGVIVTLRYVTPRKWWQAVKSAGALAKRGKTISKEDKLSLARELFPQLADMLKRKKDHNRADALLIAYYGSTREGDSAA